MTKPTKPLHALLTPWRRSRRFSLVAAMWLACAGVAIAQPTPTDRHGKSAAAAPRTPTPSSTAEPASRADTAWHVFVEQNGKVTPLSKRPTLALAPFTLLLTGPATNAYAIVTARNAAALPHAPDFSQMRSLVHPDRLVHERSDRTDDHLLINDDASIDAKTARAHLWAEDPRQNLLAFLRFDVAPDGRAIAMRPVSRLCAPSFRVDRPDCRDLRELAAREAMKPKRPRRPQPAARSADDFALLVAAIPAGRLTRFESPRVFEIRFEPPR